MYKCNDADNSTHGPIGKIHHTALPFLPYYVLYFTEKGFRYVTCHLAQGCLQTLGLEPRTFERGNALTILLLAHSHICAKAVGGPFRRSCSEWAYVGSSGGHRRHEAQCKRQRRTTDPQMHQWKTVGACMAKMCSARFNFVCVEDLCICVCLCVHACACVSACVCVCVCV